jgi:hypothetical protein
VKSPNNPSDFWKAAQALAALATIVIGCAGCSGSPPAAVGRVTPTYAPETGRLQKLEYDRNGDGRADAWAHMDGTRLLRAELDEDFSGTVDRREFYTTGGSGQRAGGSAAVKGEGVLTRVELLSSAGSASRVETYERGELSQAEEDTNSDGRTDKWERYETGALASVAFDTEGAGRPTRRILYPRDGGAPRVETDPDGSGQFRLPRGAD